MIVVTNLDNFFLDDLMRTAVHGDDDEWFVRAMWFNIDIKEGSVWWIKGLGYE